MRPPGGVYCSALSTRFCRTSPNWTASPRIAGRPSGKSTAMKSIMGIERPTAGEVIFLGENVAGLPPHKIARKGFGMVFQHSRPLNRQTVLENIMVALLPDSLFMLFADKALTERAKCLVRPVSR